MEAMAPVGHKSSQKTLPTGGRTPRRHKWTQLEDTCLRAAVQVRTCHQFEATGIVKYRMIVPATWAYLIIE